MSLALGLAGVVLLILANAFFVAAEFAYVAVDRTQVGLAVQEGGRPARLASTILRRLNFHLSGAQLGITLCSLALGVLAEPVVAQIIQPIFGFLSDSAAVAWSVVLALLLTTVAQMVIGELIPKSVAVSRPLSSALGLAAPFRVFVAVFKPAVSACNAMANALLRLVRIEPTEELSTTRSRQELRRLVHTSQEGGTLREQTAVLLDRSFRFGEKTAADAFTPRPDVLALPLGGTTADLLAASSETGLSRFPVFREAPDRDELDQIVGVVHVKDVLGVPPERRGTEPLSHLVRPVLMVPESKPLDDLMLELQDESGQFAVVLDEYGSVAGIVTLEDLVEEIVGDIADEHDPVTAQPMARRWAGAHLLSGRLHADEVREACGLEVPEGDYETLAGFVLDHLGHIPSVGEGIVHEGWQIEVTEMEGRRIAMVQVVAPPPDPLTGDPT